MEMKNTIDEVIQKGLWIKNKLPKGKYQYSKLVYIKEKLNVIILIPKASYPILTVVEQMLSINNEIIVFYDGEYIDMLYKNEYDDYKEHFNRAEWDAMFDSDYKNILENLQVVSNEQNFYVDVHETMENYLTCSYDMEISEELCRHFNLKN